MGRLPGGKVVFVEGGLGGERVTVRLEREGPRLAEGRVEAVQEAAPERQHPPCSVAGRCGGCQLQHLTPAGQLSLKEQWLIQTLARVGKWDPSQLERVRGLLRCQQAQTRGYRVRARWHFDGRSLGFFGRGTHQVVPAESCMLLAPPLEAARGALQERLTSGELPRIYRRAGLVGARLEGTLLRSGSVALRLCGLVCRSRKGGSWLGRKLGRLVEDWNGGRKGRLPEIEHPAGQRFVIGRRGFLQPHHEALALYREEIRTRLAELLQRDDFHPLRQQKRWSAWDLYCGAGALSDLPRLVAGAGNEVSVLAVDREGSSLAALRRNHPWLAPGVRIEEVGTFIRERREDQAWPDILISDPPREGMGNRCARLLSRKLAGRGAATAVIWLACDNASLGRDLGPFLEAGFRIHSLALFDCFAYTVHAETVTLLWCPARPGPAGESLSFG